MVQVNRSFFDGLAAVLFLSALAWVIWSRPDLIGMNGWIKYVGVTFALLLIPAFFYLIVRKLFPQSFPTRIRIKPFIGLRGESPYNGLAVARLMELAMQPQAPSPETRARVRSEATARPLKLSVAGATIPLEGVLSTLNRWLFGPVHTIEGVIWEIDDEVGLEAWSNETRDQWRAKSSPIVGSDRLRTAILDLANQVKETFGYYQDLADLCERQLRYGAAIHFCKQLDADSRKSRLGFIFLAAGRLGDAADEFREQLKSSDEEVCDEARLGLALVDAARGAYGESIERLQIISGNRKSRANLEEATVRCYQGDFKTAQKILEKLTTRIETSLEEVLGKPRNELSLDELQSKILGQRGKDLFENYDDLMVLGEAYGLLGHCQLELNNIEAANQNFEMSANAILHRSVFDDQIHQTALDIGVRCEDQGWFDEAIQQYETCQTEAIKQFQADPEDILALTNMAWSAAGVLACFTKKINSVLSGLENSNDAETEFETSMSLAMLFGDLPEDRWLVTVLGALNRLEEKTSDKKPLEPIDPLTSEQVEEVAKIFQPSFESSGIEGLIEKLEFVRLVSKRINYDLTARHYFELLGQQLDECHIAEKFFGLACVDAISGNENDALANLMYAISQMPQLINRAKLDADLRWLRKTDIFQQLTAN